MLSEPVVKKVKEKYPADWVDMMRDFEKIKRGIDESHDFCNFMLKQSVCDVYQELIEVDLSKSFNNNICARGATMRGKRRLQIPKTVIIKMLEDVADDVGRHFSSLLQLHEVKGLDLVIMVGGFSNLSILRKNIQHLSQYIPVIVPEEAELAVLKGAAMFGWNANFITKRRSKATYGMKVFFKFDPELDAGRYKEFDSDGVAECLRFDTLVTVNQEISLDHKETRSSIPHKNEQTENTIKYICK